MSIEALSLNGPANFLNFGFISISIPNLIMIGLIVLLFVAALLLPFPDHRKSSARDRSRGESI